MPSVEILHFSDVLCVWAYVAQRRMAELCATFGDQILVRDHFVTVFGDTRTKLARKDGGGAAYAAHVREIGSRFGLDAIHPAAWAEVAPTSSLSCHLFLRAIGVAEADGEFAPGSMHEAAQALRVGFFEHGRDIGRRAEQREVAVACGLDVDTIERRFASGEAHAGLHRDVELVREHDIRLSPTLVFNDGRQRLNGNVGYRVIEANVRELLAGRQAGASWC